MDEEVKKERKNKKIRGPVSVRTDKGIVEIKVSRPKSVKLRCLECSGFIKKQVKECSATDCPLYEMRLTGKLDGEKAGSRRSKAIKAFCVHCFNGQKGLVKTCTDENCSFYQYR